MPSKRALDLSLEIARIIADTESVVDAASAIDIAITERDKRLMGFLTSDQMGMNRQHPGFISECFAKLREQEER